MINQQLLDFIKSQLQAGVSKEIITKELLTNGWTIQDIEETYKIINDSPIHNTILTPNETPVLNSNINNIISKKGVKYYIKKIIIFLLIIGFSILVIMMLVEAKKFYTSKNNMDRKIEQSSVINPYINNEFNFSFSYPKNITILEEDKGDNFVKLVPYFTIYAENINAINNKVPFGGIFINQISYQQYVERITKNGSELIKEDLLVKNDNKWNIAELKNSEKDSFTKIFFLEKEQISYSLLLTYPTTSTNEERSEINSMSEMFMDTFKFIDSKVNQEENIKVTLLEECLPENIKLNDVVDARIIGGKIGDNTLKIEKTAVSQKLNELKAVCSSDNKLIDQNKKEIVFYQLKGCWGILPPNGEEIMLNQDNELKDLKEKFNVIEMTCNPSGIPIP